jgi:hypothetical protein
MGECPESELTGVFIRELPFDICLHDVFQIPVAALFPISETHFELVVLKGIYFLDFPLVDLFPDPAGLEPHVFQILLGPCLLEKPVTLPFVVKPQCLRVEFRSFQTLFQFFTIFDAFQPIIFEINKSTPLYLPTGRVCSASPALARGWPFGTGTGNASRPPCCSAKSNW